MTFAQASECEETIQRRTSVRGVGRVVVWDPLWWASPEWKVE